MKTIFKTRGFLLLPIVFLATHSNAQDYIHTHKGGLIEAKIIRIGSSVVSYHELTDTALVLEMELSEIAEINLEDGKRFTYTKPNENLEYDFHSPTYRNAVAIGFISPLLGDFRVEYDRLIKPGQLLYSGLTIIGFGFNSLEDEYENYKKAGVSLNVGYKFFFTPTYTTAETRRSNAMRGSYIMGQLAFSTMNSSFDSYEFDVNTGEEHTVKNTTNGKGMAILLYIGKQWVFGGVFFVDTHAGLGYSITDIESSGEDIFLMDSSNLINMGGYNSFGDFAYAARISVGLMF